MKPSVLSPRAPVGFPPVFEVTSTSKHRGNSSNVSRVIVTRTAYSAAGGWLYLNESFPQASAPLWRVSKRHVGSNGCVLAEGRVRCWNGRRELQEVRELTDAVAIARGSGFGCAVRRSGVVSCWGRSESGVLGNGETAFFTQPIQAEGIPAALDVSIANATCARLTDGKVVCWGTEKSGHVPRAVPGLEGATRLHAAGELTCATRANREAVCWSEPGESPQVLPGGADEIVGDGALALALLDGKVSYFRRTESGSLVRLGPIEGLSQVRHISNEGSIGCALRRTGEVSCWQRPSRLLADEPLRPRLFPVPALEPAGSIFGQCAVSVEGEVFCWHGNGTQPKAWSFWRGNDARATVQMAAGRNAMCAMDERGLVSCRGSWLWDRDGARGRLELDGRVRDIEKAVAVATGEHHACAVADGGKVLCWGWNHNGALARHERWESSVPVDVKGL
jgi:alpha-tubulin suppressor-like RCC1 family protein